MTRLTERPSWKALKAHAARPDATDIIGLFERDPQRAAAFSMEAGGLFLDFSKNPVSRETLALLLSLAEQASLEQQIQAMFEGRRVNTTENRPALHTALRNRSQRPVLVDGRDVMPDVRAVLERVRVFSEAIRNGEARGAAGKPFTDVVNIGIGGSDLGPLTVCEALRPFARSGPRVHFVSNVDGAHLAATLADLEAETTLFIVSSKTFTTQETMTNARSARKWLLTNLAGSYAQDDVLGRHFAAASTNLEETGRFGIKPEQVFGFWDWVGGRYSLWSAIGLPIALAVGFERFEQLLAGAHTIDEHFRTAPPEKNMPILLALIGIWHSNFLAAPSYAVLPYAQDLAWLPMHLQQLDMESNGKRIDRAGAPVDYATGPVIWGAPGTNGQHAFFQHLHQGTRVTPCDFILAARSEWDMPGHHDILLANGIAQSEALLRGRSPEEVLDEIGAQAGDDKETRRLAVHRSFPGNRPSNTIVVDRLDASAVGALIALYEHKVFVQGAIWNINSFDQWGVELGKGLAKDVLNDLHEGKAAAGHDPSTSALIERICTLRDKQ
ncbi:MAG: glucose-6-phosphate isomerase [Betaproteobacteria bacterium SG8_40]|nr:MAG: glucose-6-phosphate isomerase [Betaproteobacteria bacterium SG8_40]